MTREESIKVLQRMKYPYKCNKRKMIISNVDRDNEALDMAIKALSQECVGSTQKHVGNVLDMRCDDAVSREAVIEWLENATYEDISYAVGTELSFLPSVIPRTNCQYRHENGNCLKVGGFCTSVDDKHCPSVTHKSGTWIDYRDDGFVECPFCGHATNCEDNIDELHYCFYCGAELSGEEQTE